MVIMCHFLSSSECEFSGNPGRSANVHLFSAGSRAALRPAAVPDGGPPHQGHGAQGGEPGQTHTHARSTRYSAETPPEDWSAHLGATVCRSNAADVDV